MCSLQLMTIVCMLLYSVYCILLKTGSLDNAIREFSLAYSHHGL